jgi:hypothetical protein
VLVIDSAFAATIPTDRPQKPSFLFLRVLRAMPLLAIIDNDNDDDDEDDWENPGIQRSSICAVLNGRATMPIIFRVIKGWNSLDCFAVPRP